MFSTSFDDSSYFLKSKTYDDAITSICELSRFNNPYIAGSFFFAFLSSFKIMA